MSKIRLTRRHLALAAFALLAAGSVSAFDVIWHVDRGRDGGRRRHRRATREGQRQCRDVADPLRAP